MSAVLLGGVRLLLVVQSATSVIHGRVRDAETGAPLPLAVVEVAELGRRTASDSTGRYRLDGLPDGAHRVAAKLLGYEAQALVAFLPAGGALEVDVLLRARPVELPDIVLRATPGGAVPRSGLDSEGRLVPTDRLSIHPLLPEPDPLLALGGGAVTLQPESPAGLQVLGAGTGQTAYLLDGIPIFSPYHSAGIFSAWNSDALAELDLASPASGPPGSSALGGVVSGLTRHPGPRLQSRGGVTTSQARATADGPLGFAPGGYLFSWRTGFSDVRAPKGEPDYLRGGTGDWLAKVQGPWLGGSVRLIGYGNRNGFSAATLADEPGAPARNHFSWDATSLGAVWSRAGAAGSLTLTGWHAASESEAGWLLAEGGVDLRSARHDWGLSATVTRVGASASTSAGLRLETSTTSYVLQYDSAALGRLGFASSTPLATAFLRQVRPLGGRMGVVAGATAALGAGGIRLAPGLEARWHPGDAVAVTGGYQRQHQFAQSLRNPESVVGNIFPADLDLGAGGTTVPVARSDLLSAGVRYRPGPSVQVGVMAYQRWSSGLLLVAPASGDPFVTSGFQTGSGRARGLTLEVDLRQPHFWLIARYRWQSSRLFHSGGSYVPADAATHALEAGLTLLPTPRTSIRLGASVLLGRRATAVANGFEWEACNLRDRGCEFGGTPHHRGEVLGGTVLPTYSRIDLSVRQEWTFTAAGRRTRIAAFGTLTNLLGRENILTYARSSSTGARVPVTMRPRAPLVAGLEWQF